MAALQEGWEVIKDDLLKVFKEFYRGGKCKNQCNIYLFDPQDGEFDFH